MDPSIKDRAKSKLYMNVCRYFRQWVRSPNYLPIIGSDIQHCSYYQNQYCR